MANDVHGAGQMNRQWDLAIGAGALLSGIALYAITIAAVPTTIVFGTEVPVACVYGSSSQACADATARFAIMKQIQPISLFVAGFGGVLMVYGALQKTDPFDQRILALESEEESRSSGSRAQADPPRVKHVRQVKQVEMGTCGNCMASVPVDAQRCQSCGAEFVD